MELDNYSATAADDMNDVLLMMSPEITSVPVQAATPLTPRSRLEIAEVRVIKVEKSRNEEFQS